MHVAVSPCIWIFRKDMLAANFSHPISIAEEEANWHFESPEIVVILKGICCEQDVVEAYEEGMISASWS